MKLWNKLKSLIILNLAVFFVAFTYSMSNVNLTVTLNAAEETNSQQMMRIFVYKSEAGEIWHKDSAITCIHYWNENKLDEYKDATFVQMTDQNDDYFGYVDVPTNINGFQFVRRDPNNSNKYWSFTDNASYSKGDNVARVFTIKRYEDGQEKFFLGEKTFDSINAIFAKHIIECYFACSSSVQNGYGAYEHLNNNFFSKFTSDAKNCLLGTDYDYDEYVQNNNSYEGLKKKSTDKTIQDKINQLEFNFKHNNVNKSTLVTSKSSKKSIVLASGVVFGVAILGGFGLFLKKRKFN